MYHYTLDKRKSKIYNYYKNDKKNLSICGVDMELQKLKYFQVVAKYQHMTKAAERICIAQPALTQAMRSLEDELGVKLFAKKGRNIVLTEFGVYLQSRLDVILPEIDGLKGELEQLKNRVNKRIRLNILVGSAFVIDAIVRYRKLYPDVVFDFEQNASKDDCDIVVTTDELKNVRKRNCKRRYVKKENVYLAVPKDSKYAAYTSIGLHEVKEENFVMLSNSRLFGVICNRFCSLAGFTPKILFESDAPSAVQDVISTGVGVAFWPETWGKIKNKNVVLLPIEKPDCQRELIIELYDSTPQSQYAEDFFQYLIKMKSKGVCLR